MSAAPPTEITIRAPAKLNLGLEVLGRRADGYHDLATIFLAVDLCDRVTIRPADSLQFRCTDHNLVKDNLVMRALGALHKASGEQRGALVELDKRIPTAAGLGGASSDAAATLRAARALWRSPLGDEELADIAALLGSDIPFFLRGGCALGRGRGELLDPLPIPGEAWFVVVVPPIGIPNKTAALYAALRPEDFSGGDDVAAQATVLRERRQLDPPRLRNAFSRALYEIAPQLAALPEVMRASGASSVALSGAGPAHYALLGDPNEAEHVARKVRARVGNGTRVYVVAPIQERGNDRGRYDVS